MSRVRLSDERGFVVGFFIKLLLVLAVLGVIAADGASIFFANLRTDDAASAAATACAANLRRTRDVNSAVAAALEASALKAEDVTVTAVNPDPRTNRCTVSTTFRATTFVVSKIGFLRKYGVAKATESADPPQF